MKKIIVVMMLLVAFGLSSFAQSAKQKAEQLASDFNKEKHKTKEKNGEVTKKDVKVEAKPDIRKNLNEYAATYELEDFDFYLTLSQLSGVWKGVFTENKGGKTFEGASLKDIKIEDGLLTAVLVKPDGSHETFEAVFITRSGNGYESRGIGFKTFMHLDKGFVLDKAFFRRQEL